MVDIPVLKVKEFIIDFTCSAIESIISNSIFLYRIKCTVDLVLYLSVLIFRSAVGSCSPSACVCRLYGIIPASIFLN